MSDSVRHFASGRPYGEYAAKYRSQEWNNPIPLPPKKKVPPPEGYTGHNAEDVEWHDIHEWEASKAKCNIGLRLNHVKFGFIPDWEYLHGKEFDIIGIDVDDHDDDPNDVKRGFAQLVSLEKDLGVLPDTWTSSARINGKAGIRFYLAPTGLMWRGDCGKSGPDIDVICWFYRYAVVFPSYHPTGGQYRWYRPGFDPNGVDACDDIPWAHELAELPSAWVDFLLRGASLT